MSTRRGLLLAPVLVVASLGAASGCRGPAFTGFGGEPSCEPLDAAQVGEECEGAFVAAGSTAGGDGSRGAPFALLSEAIASGAKVIYACAGRYDEPVVVPAGVALFGGLDCDEWRFDLEARSDLTSPPDTIPMTLANGSGTRVEGWRVTARDAEVAGGSSVALLAHQVTAAVRRVDLIAGDARDGAPGAAGDPGAAGANATDASGTNAGFGGQASCGDAHGGNGGNGTNLGNPGQSGQPSQGNAGSAGCTGGGDGDDGGDGGAGENASAPGSLSESGFTPGAPGAAGGIGVAGGGGGGGGGKQSLGGGGGGAGGCGGGGGRPGQSGGSSIALAAIDATLTIEDSTARVGRGGDGGAGGAGGPGGPGGDGGAGAGTACVGGAGGAGGAGGRGGGGAGGHAVILAYRGATPDLRGLGFDGLSPEQAGEGAGDGDVTSGLSLPMLELP